MFFVFSRKLKRPIRGQEFGVFRRSRAEQPGSINVSGFADVPAVARGREVMVQARTSKQLAGRNVPNAQVGTGDNRRAINRPVL